jgi:MFS family permease
MDGGGWARARRGGWRPWCRLCTFSTTAAGRHGSPFFNPYLREIGLTGVQIGLMGGIRPSVMLLSQPLWGMAADAWGRRRLLILTALVVALVVPGYRLGQTFGFFDAVDDPLHGAQQSHWPCSSTV